MRWRALSRAAPISTVTGRSSRRVRRVRAPERAQPRSLEADAAIRHSRRGSQHHRGRRATARRRLPPTDSSIRIHIRPGADQALIDSVAGISGVSLVDDEAAAHLIFDPASGSLANNVRDVVAENLDADGLKTAIEADRALTRASAACAPRHAADRVLARRRRPAGRNGDRVYRRRRAGPLSDRLRSDRHRLGAFPLPDRPGRRRPDRRQRVLAFRGVTPPFGADNLVVLSTESPPTSLRDELKRLDGGRDPAALLKGIQSALAGTALRDRHPGVLHEAKMTSWLVSQASRSCLARRCPPLRGRPRPARWSSASMTIPTSA